MSYRTALVPISEDPASLAAIDAVMDVLPSDGRVILMTAADRSASSVALAGGGGFASLAMAPAIEQPVEGADELDRRLSEARSRLDGTGLEVDTIISRGSPVEAILRAATDCAVDLVALRTSDPTGLSSWFHPSVSRDIADKALCHVLVVR